MDWPPGSQASLKGQGATKLNVNLLILNITFYLNIMIKLMMYWLHSQTFLQCRKAGLEKLLKTNRDLSFWSICKTSSSSTVFKYFSDCSSKMAWVNTRHMTITEQKVAKQNGKTSLSIICWNQIMSYLISLKCVFCFLSIAANELYNEPLLVSFGHCQSYRISTSGNQSIFFTRWRCD